MDTIHPNRRFLSTAPLNLAAAQLGMKGSADV
jgi:hypothetical protein